MSEVALGRTRSRSLLGTMADYAFMSQHADARREPTPSPDDLMRFLAQTPILPLNGARPIDLTQARFGPGMPPEK